MSHNQRIDSQTWFTLKEAARYLRISTRSIHRAMVKGKLRRNKVDGRYLFRQNWLDAYGCSFGQRLSKSQQCEFRLLTETGTHREVNHG